MQEGVTWIWSPVHRALARASAVIDVEWHAGVILERLWEFLNITFSVYLFVLSQCCFCFVFVYFSLNFLMMSAKLNQFQMYWNKFYLISLIFHDFLLFISWASDEPSVNPSLGLDDGGGLDDDESLMMILALEHPTLGLWAPDPFGNKPWTL